MTDSFYTPPDLAAALTRSVRKRDPHVVADVCAGDGELLRAASARWAMASLIACDVSAAAVSSMKRSHPNWAVGKCDFLDVASVRRCKALSNMAGRIDVVLLNPPFSCKGGTKHSVKTAGQTFTCSIAMAFVARAMELLTPSGVVVSILPRSVAHSEKDRELWEYLSVHHGLKVISTPHDAGFDNCAAKVLLASLHRKSRHVSAPSPPIINAGISSIRIVRGRIGMHTLDSRQAGDTPLVHTTNLQGHGISGDQHHVWANGTKVRGPAVLMPRVGTPRRDKLAVLKPRETVVLSDCVLAMKTQTLREAQKLLESMLRQWDSVSALYQGTGARYTTVARLQAALGLAGEISALADSPTARA